MEENQVVTGVDPLKDLYNEFNPKLNLAKSYDEFKNTMKDSANRRAFFDEFNSKLNLANDYNQFEDVLGLKKKDGTITSGPTRLPSQSQKGNLPDFTKGQAFAEKGFLMSAEGTKAPKAKKISIEPSLSSILGAPPEVKVLEEGEDPSLLANFSSAIAKGQIQGKVANILSAGRKPSPEELGEIAQLQSDISLLPQSKAERIFQEKGLSGLFKESPALGAEFFAETMVNSLSALVESGKKTVPAGVVMGAAAGAPFAGIGALPGALTGIAAGQTAAGYNLSTSSKILELLSKEGVDIANKESLIDAFSDENKMSKIRSTAAKYGIPIAVVDALTGGLAGKLAAGAIGKSVARKLAAGFGEAGLQIVGGASGDLAGQLSSGQDVNWDDVMIEGLAAVPGGLAEVVSGVTMERAKASSNNKTLATQIATQGVEDGTKDAIINLNRDLANNVITPEQHQQGLNFVEVAANADQKIPGNISGENRVKSIELLVERDRIKSDNQNLLQQKQNTDEAYHAGIDEEIKANEERIKKIDSEVYKISKAPVIPDVKVELTEEVKPTEVEKRQKQLENVEKINPDAGFPLFNVGQVHNDGNRYTISNVTDSRTNPDAEGVVVISKIIEPAEVDENGKMTKAATVETTIFDSKEAAQKALQDNYNKYKAIAEERLAKAQSEAKPTEEQLKTQEYAVQEPSTGEVLQRAQEGVGEARGERQRVEPIIEGVEVAKEGKQVKVDEKKIIPSLENREFTTSKKQSITFENGKLVVKDKKGQPLSERASKKALQEYADNFDYSKGERAPEVPSEITDSRQAAKYVIESSNSPLEIAEVYSSEEPLQGEGNPKFQAIAEHGMGRITTDSYKNFGDPNKIEPSMKLRFFTKEGQTIDQLAKEISDRYEGLDITPQDIVDYIEKYSRGDKSALGIQESDVALQAKDKFKQLTGLDLTPELANKVLDKELEKATKEELEILKQDYETAKQLEDAYWAEYEKTDGFTKEAPVSEVSEPEITEEQVVVPEVKENDFLYKGTDEERKKGLLKNLMKSGIPEDYKKGLEEKGLTYKVSNQVEASEAAKAIIASLGINDALEIARSEKIDPSVGSAIYAESLNNLWSNERKLKANGDLEGAKAIAKQWSDVTMEYAEKLNSKGKWTAQTAYFYKTSPMGFAIRIENERLEQFADWFEAKEKDYKKVFNEIIASEEGQALLKEEIEKITKAERAQQRQKRDKAIDSFFDGMKLKGGTYVTIIPPNVWNAAVDIMKVSVKAGDRVVVAVQNAIDHIDKELKGAEWDKEKFRKEYEAQLKKVTGESIKEADNEKILLKRTEELKRRLKENDFSAEEYKNKRTLSEKEQAAKDEYDRVKKLYDEAKKGSAEYIDKKAKQYLDRLRKRLSGISEDQKEEIIRRSIKEIVNKGGLEYDDFKDIVSETIGIKKLTDEQKAEIESLTEQSNIADDLEQKFLDKATRENIDAFKKAKAKSLEADRKLFEMTSQKADIVGTLKSLITLNYLSASTLIKNYAQNVIYQGTVRFPISLAKKGIDQSVYGATYMGNKMFGTKVIKPSISITDAQRGYFREYREGIVRGWEQMIKGVDEKDYFAKSQYASTLNPSKAVKELKASMKGELFLTPNQKIDKWIQATLGWQPYAISRGMIYGDKPPRYAAQGAEALQIAVKELGLKNTLEIEAFMISPEKYAYKHLIEKAGLSPEDASIESKAIAKRIIDAGAVATFQNENYFNDFFSKIDEWARVSKEDKWTANIIKPPVALLKASQLPFVKTPANVAWVFFKIANPSFTMLKSLTEAGLAQNSFRKGNLIKYKEYTKNAKESFGLAAIGIGITAAAAGLANKGLIRTSVQDEDKAREKAGEGFFGKSNELNLGVLLGGGDYWVDLSWFGPVGTIIDIRGRMMEDNKQKELRGEKVEHGVMNEIIPTMKYSVSSTLNTLVFDQGAKMVDALRKGGGALNQIVVNNANALSNIVLGSTIASMNKAMAPEKTDLAADNIIDQIINNQKQRNVFVTWAAGYPPSKVSIWGEPMPQDRSISGVLGSMLGFEKGSADKFGAILYNEQRRTGINEFFPPVEDKKIKVNGKDVQITVEEKRDLDTYIGQARKAMISPFLNDKTTYTVLLDNGEYGDFTYSELTAGKNKDGQTISQEEADKKKLAALDLIYKNGKEAGFAKFKDKYKQYQDATLDVEKIVKKAYEGAEKSMFEAKLQTEPK
jgi:hypothetical protein